MMPTGKRINTDRKHMLANMHTRRESTLGFFAFVSNFFYLLQNISIGYQCQGSYAIHTVYAANVFNHLYLHNAYFERFSFCIPKDIKKMLLKKCNININTLYIHHSKYLFI